MSFIQAGFLMAASAVAIPLLVHLLSRWQVRRVELGTMRFLQEVIQDGSQSRKIRRWLLLLTRAALAALLAFLFARPFLPEATSRDGDRLRVVLIDRSASMGMPGKGGRLIDDAIAAATESVSGLGSDAKIIWAWFDRNVQPMSMETLRPTAPSTLVGDTNYLSALSWARDKVNAYPKAVADVVLVTDLQQSGLAGDQILSDAFLFPKDVPIEVVDVGRPAANNLAITNLGTGGTTILPKSNVVIAVTLFNFGSLPFEEVPLTAAAFDGSRTIRLKKSINIPSDQATEVEFDFGKLDPATWQITIAMDVEDDLAADNTRFTAVEVASPVEVMVMDSGSADDGSGAESYFLKTALERSQNRRLEIDPEIEDSEPNGRFHADVIYLSDDATKPIDPDSHPLMVVADSSALSAAMIEQVSRYVAGGGKLLVFAGETSESILQQWQTAGLAPGTFGKALRSGTMPFRISLVEGGGSMLQPFSDPQHGDLSRLAFQKIQTVEVDQRTRVLAQFDHARPAVTTHNIGKGRVVWFLSSADASWGSWTMSPLYLPLVQQMAADLMNMTGEGPIRFRSVGDPILNTKPNFADASDNQVTKVALAGDSSLAESTIFETIGFDNQKDALYIVNGNASESDPTRMEKDAFLEHFDLVAKNTDSTTTSSVDSIKRNELWPWFAAAIFVLLIAEFGLANRTPA